MTVCIICSMVISERYLYQLILKTEILVLHQKWKYCTRRDLSICNVSLLRDPVSSVPDGKGRSSGHHTTRCLKGSTSSVLQPISLYSVITRLLAFFFSDLPSSRLVWCRRDLGSSGMPPGRMFWSGNLGSGELVSGCSPHWHKSEDRNTEKEKKDMWDIFLM